MYKETYRKKSSGKRGVFTQMRPQTYKIIRYFQKDGKKPRVIHRGFSLEEAKRHCKSASSKKTNKYGDVVWFDGFAAE